MNSSSSATAAILDVLENPQLLNELENDDLISLRTVLQDDDDPRFDALWEVVLSRTGSLEH